MTVNRTPLQHLAALTPHRRQLSPASLLGPTGSFSPTTGTPPPESQAAGSSSSQPAGSSTSPSPGGSENSPIPGNTTPSTDDNSRKSAGSATDTSPGATTPVKNDPQPALPSGSLNPTAPSLASPPADSPSPTLATPTPAAAAAATPTPTASGSNQQTPPSEASLATPTPAATPTTPDAISPLSTPTPVANTPLPISDRPLTAATATPTLAPAARNSTHPLIMTTHDAHGQIIPITSTVNVQGVRTAAAPSATGPFSPSTHAQSNNESSGLSTGAITVIAIIAGITGFIILFWLGVQLLQSKRRKREEADMQEIDFDPSGGGSANGDTFRALGINRNPSSGNGHGENYNQRHSPHDSTEKPYDEDVRMYTEYPGPPTTVTPPILAGVNGGGDELEGLQHQATIGGRSIQTNPSSGVSPQAYYSGPGQGYYPGDPRTQTYPQAGTPGHFSPPQHRFDPSPPMPPHPYEYADGPDYSSDPHNPPYRGHVGANSGVGYGTMIARSTSPPLNFHYPPNSTATAI